MYVYIYIYIYIFNIQVYSYLHRHVCRCVVLHFLKRLLSFAEVPVPSASQLRKSRAAKGKKTEAVDWLADAPYASEEALVLWGLT